MPASVTMNAGMPTYATQKPCQAPIAAPSARQQDHREHTTGTSYFDHQDRGDRAGERGDRARPTGRCARR